MTGIESSGPPPADSRQVTAVVLSQPGSRSFIEPSITGQSRPPQEIITAHPRRHGPQLNLAQALSAALKNVAAWIWLIDAAVRPEPEALARLLDAAAVDLGSGPPTVLASMVLSPDRHPRDHALPRGAERETPALLAAAQRGLVPIRNAPFVSTLLHRQVIERHGLPQTEAYGIHAPIEYTARALRTDVGFLVPASTVIAPGLARGRPDSRRSSIAQTTRMARTDVWTRGERVRALGACARSIW